jgi:hypothetical protein
MCCFPKLGEVNLNTETYPDRSNSSQETGEELCCFTSQQIHPIAFCETTNEEKEMASSSDPAYYFHDKYVDSHDFSQWTPHPCNQTTLVFNLSVTLLTIKHISKER